MASSAAGIERRRAVAAARAEVAECAQREVGRAVEREQTHDGDAGEHGVGAEQVEEVAREPVRREGGDMAPPALSAETSDSSPACAFGRARHRRRRAGT